MRHKYVLAIILNFWALAATAQEAQWTQDVHDKQETVEPLEAPKPARLDVKLSGRAVFDAAAFSQNDAAVEQDGKMNSGVQLRDVRIGIKAEYGKWYFRGDISLAGYKISAKDLFLQYRFSKQNHIRLGHYSVPFGLSSYYSSAKKEYLDEPEANIFQIGRRIGILHTIYNHSLWGQYGVFADNLAMSTSTDKSGPQGYFLGARFVWRPVMNDQYGFHLGISGMRVKPESDGAGGNHTAYSKTYLNSVDKRPAISVDITDAKWENKFTAEFQGIYRNWQLCSQYYWTHIGRTDCKSYNSNGFYVSARGIIVNPANYQYNYDGSGVDNPADKNLELMLGFGYLDLEDSKAIASSYIEGMEGAGRMKDISAGLTFFWNKYVTLRMNYHCIYAKTYNHDADKRVNVLQMRVQYLF